MEVSAHGRHRLKSFNEPGHIVYTIGQINTYPFGIYALQFVTCKFRFFYMTAAPIFIVQHWFMLGGVTQLCLAGHQ
jgi:hypothetical protein